MRVLTILTVGLCSTNAFAASVPLSGTFSVRFMPDFFIR
jgi:hypothetical protein